MFQGCVREEEGQNRVESARLNALYSAEEIGDRIYTTSVCRLHDGSLQEYYLILDAAGQERVSLTGHLGKAAWLRRKQEAAGT